MIIAAVIAHCYARLAERRVSRVPPSEPQGFREAALPPAPSSVPQAPDRLEPTPPRPASLGAPAHDPMHVALAWCAGG